MNENERNKIAKAASKLYSTDRMVSDYYDLYDEIAYNKRILLIDVNYKYSSTGQIVYDIYSSANKYDKDVSVCYGRGERTKDKNVYKFGYDWETYLHAGLSRITGYNGCFSYFSTKRLIKFIEAFKPDVIHIHELHAYFVNIKQLVEYVKRKSIPLVWTFHCEYMYTGKCGYAYDCQRFRDRCGNCPAVREYPKSLFFDRTEKMLSEKKHLLKDLNFTIVTPSGWVKDRVELSFLKDKPIHVIYNGVDTSVFYPRSARQLKERIGINDYSKVALFVAPNVGDERKGARWVVKIAEELKDENVVFLMVGAGTYDEPFPKNVKFVGQVHDKNDMAEYYSISDVFLICSERETYSMTCAEALCCGTPIIGFECGAPEKVFKGANACFVPYGDAEQLKNRLLSFLRNDQVGYE